MFKEVVDKKGFTSYVYSEKLSSGKTAKVSFHEVLYNDQNLIYNVEFQIYRKREETKRGDCFERITGIGGVEGLSFARDVIILFEDYAIRRLARTYFRKYDTYMTIGGADNRRQSAYRYMERYGYKLTHKFGEKIYLKKLN